MAAVTQYVQKISLLPGGEKLVRGYFAMSNNYYTGGDLLNIANYILSTDNPTVVCGASSGYVFMHDAATASAGKVIAYFTMSNNINSTIQNIVLCQVMANTDLSAVNVPFFAIGQAH